MPEELLLVETDSPYLAPQPVRGKPNQPANVVATARAVAEVRGVAYEELERTVEANARAPLRLVSGADPMVRLGQNFLADPNLLDAIVRDAGLGPGDVVLEVGAGEGVLTERLAAVAAHRPRGRDRPRPGAGAGGGRGAARTSTCTGATR